MTGSTRLSTWISNEAKQRFSTAAARQSLSESALLKRLVEQMLASAEIEDFGEPIAPPDPRDARLTVRLVPEAIARTGGCPDYAGRDLRVGPWSARICGGSRRCRIESSRASMRL